MAAAYAASSGVRSAFGSCVYLVASAAISACSRGLALALRASATCTAVNAGPTASSCRKIGKLSAAEADAQGQKCRAGEPGHCEREYPSGFALDAGGKLKSYEQENRKPHIDRA